MDVIPRTTARVLPVTPDGRVLMMHGHDPQHPEVSYWFTPGGGLEPGETLEQGAIRELFEETGLQLPPELLGEPIDTHTVDVPFDGVVYRQQQTYFGVVVPQYLPRPGGLDPDELRSVTDCVWWTLPELAAHPDRVYPEHLADLVALVLQRAQQ